MDDECAETDANAAYEKEIGEKGYSCRIELNWFVSENMHERNWLLETCPLRNENENRNLERRQGYYGDGDIRDLQRPRT